MNILFFIITVIIVTQWLLLFLNAKRRISDTIKNLGGEMIEMEWAPLSGPFGIGLDRRVTYLVRYKDKNDKVHSAYCGIWLFKQEINFYDDYIETIYKPKQH